MPLPKYVAYGPGLVSAHATKTDAEKVVATSKAGGAVYVRADTVETPKTDIFGRSVNDWPNQAIRCKHCGLTLNRIDLPPPEGPDREGIHGWIHVGVMGPGSAVFCPPQSLGGPSLGVAEPSDSVKVLVERAMDAARREGRQSLW